MKIKKYTYLFIAITLVFIILGSIYVINNKSNSNKIAKGLIKVELKPNIQYDNDIEHPKVIESYSEFLSYFTSSSIRAEEFDKNNYAIIILNYDNCSYTNVVPTKYNIFGNTINVTAYHDGCSSCKPLYAYYAVKINKNIKKINQNIKWIARNKNECK